ncbi:hypothetical protein HMPREF1585_01445, partial [Gardnerella vaginalis JCP8481B]
IIPFFRYSRRRRVIFRHMFQKMADARTISASLLSLLSRAKS